MEVTNCKLNLRDPDCMKIEASGPSERIMDARLLPLFKLYGVKQGDYRRLAYELACKYEPGKLGVLRTRPGKYEGTVLGVDLYVLVKSFQQKYGLSERKAIGKLVDFAERVLKEPEAEAIVGAMNVNGDPLEINMDSRFRESLRKALKAIVFENKWTLWSSAKRTEEGQKDRLVGSIRQQYLKEKSEKIDGYIFGIKQMLERHGVEGFIWEMGWLVKGLRGELGRKLQLTLLHRVFLLYLVYLRETRQLRKVLKDLEEYLEQIRLPLSYNNTIEKFLESNVLREAVAEFHAHVPITVPQLDSILG